MTDGVEIFIWVVGFLIGLGAAASVVDFRKTTSKEEEE